MHQPSRETGYRRLIRLRHTDPFPVENNLINPVDTPFDPPHIGCFAAWAGDLGADILIVHTDWRSLEQYLAQEGKPALCTPHPDKGQKWARQSSAYLLKLMQSIGRDIGLPHNPKSAGVFLANAVPFLGM